MQRTTQPSGPWRVVPIAQQYDLSRFTEAHQIAYADALAELKDGAKYGHWIWYIFPQIAGLGMSATSQKYSIKDIGEARAYFDHKILGAHYRECCEAILAFAGKKSAAEIFGSLDAMKLRSSLTLFIRACNLDATHSCARTLNAFFGGDEDPQTLEILRI